jgi:hypothetical protein
MTKSTATKEILNLKNKCCFKSKTNFNYMELFIFQELYF